MKGINACPNSQHPSFLSWLLGVALALTMVGWCSHNFRLLVTNTLEVYMERCLQTYMQTSYASSLGIPPRQSSLFEPRNSLANILYVITRLICVTCPPAPHHDNVDPTTMAPLPQHNETTMTAPPHLGNDNDDYYAVTTIADNGNYLST